MSNPSIVPPMRVLPPDAEIGRLRKEAKKLLAAHRAGDPAALREVSARFPLERDQSLSLQQAQLVIARSYGFDGWPQLKAKALGFTAGRLLAAVEAGDQDQVADILERRPELVNRECPGRGEMRVIHAAVLSADVDMVRLLVERGADSSIGIWPRRESTSAKALAAERGLDVISSLLVKGTKPLRGALEGPQGKCPFDPWDRAQILARLGRSPENPFVDPPWTLLHAAAARLDLPVARAILETGVRPDPTAEAGLTPLGAAAAQLSSERRDDLTTWVGEFRNAGARLDPVTAVALGDAEAVEARHASRALTRFRTWRGERPYAGLLSIAVQHDREDMVRLLLEIGFDPDERVVVPGPDHVVESWGMPLYRCAAASRYQMARQLLEAGADPNAQVCASGTPVGRAFGARDQRMVHLLESFGGVVYAANAGYYRDLELARRLICQDEDGVLEGAVDPGSTLHETLLESAATGGDPAILSIALAGIDWPRDDQRWFWRLWDTLCYWHHRPGIPTADPSLPRSTYLECFTRLLTHASPRLRRPYFGQTILHEIAAMEYHVTDDEVVEFARTFLRAGAELDPLDRLHEATPLAWACARGRRRLVEVLLDEGADPAGAASPHWARPRTQAERMGFPDIAALLHDWGVD